MGFGFNLGMVFIFLPIIAILFVLLVATKKQLFGKAIAGIIIGISTLVLFSSVMSFLNSKTELNKNDYYGSYIVDRNYFPGKQADWQYNSFRFDIKDNDSVYFYHLSNNKIIKTYKGSISTVKPFNSQILVMHMEQPTHHILTTNPTIYRGSWDFELVFNSTKFNNMFFKKGDWQPIKNNKK
jgi:hypothetical protein